MLKFLLTAAPYLISARNGSSEKQIATSFTALLLFAISGVTLAAATFIYITSVYGAAVGFMCVSALSLAGGLAVFFNARRPRAANRENLPGASTSDPLAALVPDSVMKDPVISKLINQAAANPVASSAIAAAIGMLITREIMKD